MKQTQWWSLRPGGRRVVVGLVVAAGLLLAAAQAAPLRAAPDALSLTWYTVDGGGSSQSGSWQLDGVVGQPDAGRLSSGALVLTGGFLQPGGAGSSSPALKLYLPQLSH